MDVFHVHLVEHSWVLTILRLVVSVDLHRGHLLLELLGFPGFLLLLALLFLLLLLLLLGLSKLVENVLIVQDGVRELIFEVLVIQEGLCTGFDDVEFQDLVDRWTLGGVLVEHHSEEVGDIFAEMAGDVSVLACNDLLSEHVK